MDKWVNLPGISLLPVFLIFSSLSFADPLVGTREVLLDNETVEVVRLTYPPGAESGMHTHKYPGRAVYFVKGGKMELIPADLQQASQVIDAPDGKAIFLPATTHNIKNIGDTEVVIVETEIKEL